MSYSGKSPNVNRLRLNPRSADPTNPTEGDVQYADGSAREEGVWVYKNGAWTQIASSSSSGINYVTDGDGESGQTTNWATYADAAAAIPVDGTGGSPNVTFAVTSVASEVLRGSRSLKFVKDAANRQGQGVANTITLERQDYESSKNLFVTFDYKTTANFATGDVRVFVYDITNAIVYNVQSLTSAGDIAASTTASRFVGVFQSVASSTQYRVIFHVATTNALAYDLILDDVSVSPDAEVPGFIGSSAQTFTPTGTWSTNSTYTGKWWRVGDQMIMRVNIALAGAPTASDLQIDLPSGYFIDTAKLPTTGVNDGSFGSVTIKDSATRQYTGSLQYVDTSTISVGHTESGNNGFVNATNPIAFANGDSVSILASFPIQGWDASAAFSTTENLMATARVSASRSTSAQSFTSGATTTMIFDTENKDTLGNYNPSTGEFTAPKTGDYFIGANFFSATQTAMATNERIIMYVFVNGVQTKALAVVSDGSQSQTGVAGSILMPLSAGDVVTIRLFQDSGSTLTTITNTGHTNLSIFQVPDFSIFSVYGQTEYAESKASGVVAWPFTAGAYGDLTSLVLQPGEYDLTGMLEFSNGGAVTAGFVLLGISTTSGNSGVGLAQGDNRSMGWNVGTSGVFQTINVPNYRVVVTVPTTYYLKGYNNASVTNVNREGYKLSARRIK